MTALAELPTVGSCTVEGCSFNNDGCHAHAITVGGAGQEAACATFIPLSIKGGLDRISAAVGACQRSDCKFNEALSCTAASIQIGAGVDTADCLTYEKA